MREQAGGHGATDGHGPEVGSVAEEAAKLFGALGDWARTQTDGGTDGVGHLADALGRAVHDVDEHLATGGAECRYCPVCRAVQAFRDTSPEVRAHLTTAAVSLVQAAGGLLATAVPDPDDGGVEHIDLDESAEDWSEEP